MTSRKFVWDPGHWRFRAEEARTVADQMTHEDARTIMRRIANDYDRLAKLAEEQLADQEKRPTADDGSTWEGGVKGRPGVWPTICRLGKGTGLPPLWCTGFWVQQQKCFYALDITLDLRDATKSQIERAMRGHVLANAELIGTYQKGDR